MYMQYGASDYRKFVKLPEDYTVDGILTYGVWDLDAEELHIPYLKKVLESKNIEYKLKRFEQSDLGHGYELIIDGKTYWFVPVMGAAVMSVYVHIASLLGSKRNIILGTVGGLAPGMNACDLIIPTSVIGNDNARMYDRENILNTYNPDESLLLELKNKLEKTDLKIWEGQTTTCEIILAETKEDIDRWSNGGILGVEMETAIFLPLQNTSKYRPLLYCSLLII